MPRSGTSGHMSSLPSRYHSGTFGTGASRVSDPLAPFGFPREGSSHLSDSSEPNLRPDLEGTIHSEQRELHDAFEFYFIDEEDEKKPAAWLRCCRLSPKLLAFLVVLTVLLIAITVPLVGTVGKDTMTAENNLLSGQGSDDQTQGSGDGNGQAARRSFDERETERLLPLLRPEELFVVKGKRKS